MKATITIHYSPIFGQILYFSHYFGYNRVKIGDARDKKGNYAKKMALYSFNKYGHACAR